MKSFKKSSLVLFSVALLAGSVLAQPPEHAPAKAPFVISAKAAPADLPADQRVGELELVAEFHNAMPTGVTVTPSGRIFVNFPRWGDDVPFTVAALVNGKAQAFPNAKMNQPDPNNPRGSLLSVQSVVADSTGRLWALDTGRIEWKPTVPDGAKLVAFDAESGKVLKTIVFPEGIALPDSYLNDVRFDLRRGREGMAFITDSSPNGKNALIVVDLADGTATRRLDGHPSTLPEPNFLPVVEGEALMNRPAQGEPTHMSVGADGIAIGPHGSTLYYSALSGRHLYSVAIDDLISDRPDRSAGDAVSDLGDKGGGSDGLECDSKGAVYMTNYEHNAILRRETNGTYQTVVHDPRVLWPDTLSLAADGYLYFIANQLHRQPGFHKGVDQREKPYSLFRVKVDRTPVMLKP